MSLLDEVESIPRRTMVLFFVIGTSGSMSGSKIGSVNTAIEELISEIRDISTDTDNNYLQIEIAVLQFSSGYRWITPSGPVPAEKFHWNMIDAGGRSDFGAACMALNSVLSTKKFMKRASGSYAPVIILLSDGEPTDNWQPELDKLKQNNWFKVSTKIAIAVGQDANHTVLEQFTGSSEAVLEWCNNDLLKRIIKKSYYNDYYCESYGGESFEDFCKRYYGEG